GNIAGFAVLYTLGNVVSLLSTMFLVGPVRQFKMAFAPVRLVATIIYLASMIVTLIVAIKTSKVVLCVIFIIIQICAMVWYAASYIPYGRALIRKVVGNAVNM
ncbi:SFT2-like protein, partial [Ramicandelaber brevisporus]